MEVIMVVGLLVMALWLWMQNDGVGRLRRTLSDLDHKFETWTRWLHGFYTDVQALRSQIDTLSRRVTELERERQALTEAAREAARKIAPVTETVPASVEPRRDVEVAPVEAAPVEAAPLISPAESPPESPVEAPPSPPAASPRPSPAGWPVSAPASIPAPPPRPGFDWESLIGVRLFSWIAGVSLLLGAIFFLRYSAENGWLSPTIRMAMGFLAGIGLLLLCEFRGQRYRITANAMDAAGIGTLFSTSFAANAVWHLIPTTVAFLLLVLVTAVAVLLAVRRESLFIALLGLVGGFATPILLSTGENRPIGLFGYLLLLNAGLGFVGYRQRWLSLLAVSIALTTLYQWGWVAKFAFGDSSQIPVAVAVFLVFPLLWIASHRLWQNRLRDAIPEWMAELISFGSALPLLFALSMAWFPAFGQRYLLLFGYLFVLVVGLLVLDHHRPKDRLGNFAGLGCLLVWVGWLRRNYDSDAWPVVVFFLAGFVMTFLVAQWLRSRARRAPSPARFAAPALLIAFALLATNEPTTASPYLLFSVLFGLLLAVAATAIFLADGWLYYAAVPSVLLAQASWSLLYLTVERLIPALVIYLAFALLFVLVPVVSRKLGRPFVASGMTTVVAPMHLTLLLFLATRSVAAHSLWIIGLMMIVLNVGAFIEARSSRRQRAAFVGIGLSWLVLVVWWFNAIAPERIVAALVVVLALVLLSVGGILWMLSGSHEHESNGLLEQGPLLGLIGHLFLLFVATQPALNYPPWPLFAILVVLDLALIAASLYLGRALFGAAGLALSVLVLGVWSVAVVEHPQWLNATEITLLVAAIVGTFGVALPTLAKRRGFNEGPFLWGRDVTLLLIQALLIELGATRHPPHLVGLLVSQLLVMALLARSANARGLHWLLLPSWGLACLGQLAWAASHLTTSRWGELLAMAFVPYALLSAYPVYCHFQVQGHGRLRRWPFVIAICGSLGFFAAGYSAIHASPFAGFMGALPVFESLVMAGLLLFVLRVVEPAAQRDTGRLALIAAVALGFATTAIPLQLENEWLTIAWALEAAVLGWLYQRLYHTGLIAGSLALATAVTIRLVANPEVFLYHTRSATPILNYYLYAYLTAAIALYSASWFLRAARELRWPWLSRAGFAERAFATLLLFVLLNIEIADYHSTGTHIHFRFSSTLAQDLSYTLGWAAFAIGMLVVGICLQGRAARISALALLTITIAKCFLHDLWRLGGLYRVGSFVGLALCLALVAILLQRFVLKSHRTEDP